MSQNSHTIKRKQCLVKCIVIYLISSVLCLVFVYIFTDEWNSTLSQIFSELITIIFVIIFCSSELKYMLNYLNSRYILTFRSIVCFIGIGITYNLIVDTVDQILKLYKYIPDSKTYFEFINSLNYSGIKFGLIVLAIGIVGPIIEEVIFRGLLLEIFMNKLNITVAVLLDAFIFAVFHGNLYQGFYAFTFGILVCFFYLWTRTIIVPIIIHISANTFTLFMKNVSINSKLVFILFLASLIFFTRTIFIFYKLSLLNKRNNHMLARK